jgi:cytochrome c oxidase cbb3-type subunit 4
VNTLDPTYQAVAEFAQTWGLAYFVIVFALMLLYVLRPSRKTKFDEAARIPFRED